MLRQGLPGVVHPLAGVINVAFGSHALCVKPLYPRIHLLKVITHVSAPFVVPSCIILAYEMLG